VDRLIRANRRRLQVRDEDGTLGVFPDLGFPLNGVILGVIEALLAGRRMSVILERTLPAAGGVTARTDRGRVLRVFEDLRRLLEEPLSPGRSGSAEAAARLRGARHMQYAKAVSELPVACQVTLTYNCEVRCTGCRGLSACTSGGTRGLGFTRELSAREWRYVLKKVAGEAKLAGVTLSGGEPLRYGEFWRVLKYARDAGLEVHLVTCGGRLTKGAARRLAGAGVQGVTLRLFGAPGKEADGWSGEEGREAAVLGAMQVLGESGVPYRLYAAVSRVTARGFGALVRWAARHGVKELWADLSTREPGSEPLPLGQLGEWLAKLAGLCADKGIRLVWSPRLPLCIADPVAAGALVRCSDIHDGMLHLAPDGSVLTWVGSSRRLGDLTRQKLGEFWVSPTVRNLRLLSKVPPPCRECLYHARCMGGALNVRRLVGEGEMKPVKASSALRR
jgi:MoaA/NifB/PqqE/SkfB family radical SAM enzyme